MKIWAIARHTFGSFLRNRLLIVFGVVFVCTVLLMLTPLLGIKAMARAGSAQQAQVMAMEFVAAIMSLVSGAGSLLAAWCAADSVAGEIKTGTILAVMARPVKRWQFLMGKYVAVMMLMVVYVAMMFALSWFLAWIAGQRIQSSLWVLLVYPMVRYAVYAALAMALVTLLHPVMTMGIVLLMAIVAFVVAPTGETLVSNWKYLRVPVWVLLPSTSLLSESRFLTITHASLRQASWSDHLITLAYGLDYALVLVLLAMWLFHSRPLTRE